MELAEYISNLGYNTTALNGDIPQNQRLRSVEQFKAGKTDILVATDVAARGLDVERVSHVINFDIPFDTESYIHRIGRTGRAGREGKAILFVSPREKSMLKAIERATKQKINPIKLPAVSEINRRRIEKYKQRITETLATDCTFFHTIIKDYCRDYDVDKELVAAALAKMVQGERPLLLEEEVERPSRKHQERGKKKSARKKCDSAKVDCRKVSAPEQGMDRYRLEVGEMHGVKPGNIVGAIANEADIDSEYIGRIFIFDEFSTVDLPAGMPRAIKKVLFNARINGKMMRLNKSAESGEVDGQGVTGGKKDKRKKDTGKPHRKSKRRGSNDRASAVR